MRASWSRRECVSVLDSILKQVGVKGDRIDLIFNNRTYYDFFASVLSCSPRVGYDFTVRHRQT